MNKIDLLQNVSNSYGAVLSDEQIDKFIKFENLIKKFNIHTNLMSSNDIDIVWNKHFIDCISICKFMNNDNKYKIADIGSGGGFPVVIEAIMLPDSSITAIESTGKKSAFLSQVAQNLNLSNLTVYNARAEELAYRKSFRETFDIVTTRAVGNLSIISELCIPYLKVGGKFIAFKSSKVEEEIKNAQYTISIMGGKITDIFEYDLQLEEIFKRNLVVIEKISQTPENYPRSFSLMKNKPLSEL